MQLVSTARPEKMDRYTKLRTTSGTMNIHQQSSPPGDHKYRGDNNNNNNMLMLIQGNYQAL